MFKQMAKIREKEVQEFVEFTGLNTEICGFMYDMHPSLESAKESWAKVSDKVKTESALQKNLNTVPKLLADGDLVTAILMQQDVIQFLMSKND